MEGIAHRGAAAMKLLLLVALLCAWACFEKRPPVLRDAVSLVDGTLRSYSIQAAAKQDREFDVLSKLPTEAQMVLRQYRHQFQYSLQFYDDSDQAEKEKFLGDVTASTFFQLNSILKSAPDQPPAGASALSAALPEMIVDDLRASMARIQTLHQQSGLGPTATLGQVAKEVTPRIQIPGSLQSIEVERCMLFFGGCIVMLQLYLVSLLETFQRVANGVIPDGVRSWVLLHHGSLGHWLTIGWLAAPVTIWGLRQILMPLQMSVLPEPTPMILFCLMCGTTWLVLHRTSQLRNFDQQLHEQQWPVARPKRAAA